VDDYLNTASDYLKVTSDFVYGDGYDRVAAGLELGSKVALDVAAPGLRQTPIAGAALNWGISKAAQNWFLVIIPLVLVLVLILSMLFGVNLPALLTTNPSWYSSFDELSGIGFAGGGFVWGSSGGGTKVNVGPVKIPQQYLPWFKSAGAEYGIPWYVLVAIAKVESDFNPDAIGPPNCTGELAEGMMQFLPSTWEEYGTGSPFDPKAAIYATARMLAADGGATNIEGAIFDYNHAYWYVDEVMSIANEIRLSQPNSGG